MNRRQVIAYKRWLEQVLYKDELTSLEVERILDGQLQLPAREMDSALIQECRLFLYPETESADAPGKQETMEKVRTYLQQESRTPKSKAAGAAGSKHHFGLRPAAVISFVLLIVLLLGTTIDAFGFNIWQLLHRINGEQMNMEIALHGKIKGSQYVPGFGGSEEDDFHKKLAELRMEPRLPANLPKGFMLERAESGAGGADLKWVLGTYTNRGQLLQISVYQSAMANGSFDYSFEKDERELDVYDRGGIRFYIMDNLTETCAYWVDPPYSLSLGGDVTREELLQTIDSIFERGI